MSRNTRDNLKKSELRLLWYIYTNTVTPSISIFENTSIKCSLFLSIMYLISYTHGTKRIRLPTSYSTNREFFEARDARCTSIAHTADHVLAHMRGLFSRCPAYTGTYYTKRSLFMSERFIESENTIVAIKRAKTFYSRAAHVYTLLLLRGTRFTWIP